MLMISHKILGASARISQFYKCGSRSMEQSLVAIGQATCAISQQKKKIKHRLENRIADRPA